MGSVNRPSHEQRHGEACPNGQCQASSGIAQRPCSGAVTTFSTASRARRWRASRPARACSLSWARWPVMGCAGDADWIPGRWQTADANGDPRPGGAAASARCLCAGRRPARAAAARAHSRSCPPPGNSPQRIRVDQPSQARPAVEGVPGGQQPEKDRGSAPDPGPPSEMSAHQVIPSPSQAVPYARTPGPRKGSLRSAFGRPLHAPENRAPARRVSDRGDDLTSRA
jgi:hypothetical protein